MSQPGWRNIEAFCCGSFQSAFEGQLNFPGSFLPRLPVSHDAGPFDHTCNEAVVAFC